MKKQSEALKRLEFVPMVESDRAFFIDVHHRSYRYVIESMFGWDDDFQDAQAAKAFDQGGMHSIIVDGQKIGVVGWDIYPDHIWLKEVFVLPDYQNQGIGSQVLRVFIEKAKTARKDMRLRTLKANLRAKALYERYGFEVTEATDIHWNMVLPFSDMP